MLHSVRFVSVDIWHIERYIFWPLWFSKPTISSTVITFSSVCVCFSLPVSCLWLVLNFFQISVNNIPTLSLLHFIFKNSPSILPKLYFFELVQVLNQSFVSTAKWHVTSLLYRQCIKNYYLQQYHLILFTKIISVFKTKHNLFFV